MPKIDVNKLREPTIQIHRYADFDSPFEFYYDETNNFRKLVVREVDLNFHFNANFILGGIVFQENEPDFASLFEGLRLQKNITEVKFKHIASGSFINCLNSKKLNYFLKFLNEHNINIHVTSINLLYYSLVDIVDSAIMNHENLSAKGMGFNMHLKNVLYRLSKLEYDSLIELFYRFEYPNIKNDVITDFINELISLFDGYLKDEEFKYWLNILKFILKESDKNSFLPFITDEEDYILLTDFSDFYLKSLYNFKNSKHHFDKEDKIEVILDDFELLDGESILNNYEFIDSKDSQSIQVSDIIVGIMGKFSIFVNSTDIETLKAVYTTFNEVQIENIRHLMQLISDSSDYNPAFIHSIDAILEFEKYALINKLIKAWNLEIEIITSPTDFGIRT